MIGRSFPVPVYPAIGLGAWGLVQELRGRPEIRLVASPRHAAVLLAAGAIPHEHGEALARVHDQVPHPRRSVAWAGGLGGHPVATTVVTGPADELVAAIRQVYAELRADRKRTEPDLLPDEDPNEWRGVGPYGQGGEGMMGGVPYGRPMAMTGDDRDGLTLDQLHLRLGPFLDALPAGVVLDVTLQGEVLQQAELHPPAAAPNGLPPPDDLGDDPAVASARRGLRWLAHALHVHGLDPHAARAAQLAVRAAGDDVCRRFRVLHRAVKRSGVLWSLRGVGPLHGGDAAARWVAHLDRIDTALSGEPTRASSSPRSFDELGSALAGMTIADAVATIVSLDLATEAEQRSVSR